MPKTEAEIARPYQQALDKARTELNDAKKEAAKALEEASKAAAKEKEFFLEQIEEMKEAIQAMGPDVIVTLKKELAEVREHHGQLLTELEKKVSDHQHTESKLKDCLDQLLAADEVRIDLQLKIAELEKQIPSANAPGRPRTRRSQRQ